MFDQLRVNVTKAVTRSRHVALAVADFLDRQPHDLVVLATEGLEASPGWIRNRSDAEAIANWSRTMTLFVPARATRGLISLENGSFDFKNVLVPVDVEPDCSAERLPRALRTCWVMAGLRLRCFISVIRCLRFPACRSCRN